MTENQRSPRAYVIDILIAIDVNHMRAFTARDKTRYTCDCVPRSYRTVHAARNFFLRSVKESL